MEEDGKKRLDPLVLGSITLLGFTGDEVMASDRRLKRAGIFEVPPGSIMALLAPTRGGLARLVSIGRVLVTVSMESGAYSTYNPASFEDSIAPLDEELKEFLGEKDIVTPLERVKDGYLILAENVLRAGIFYPGMGEFPDEGYLITERWLELAGLKGGISGLWGRTWGRLFVLEPREGLMLMLGLLASSPTYEELVTGRDLGSLDGLTQGELFARFLRGEINRLRYLGWHLLRK